MRSLLILSLVLLLSGSAIAADVVLAWDASPSSGVVGYKVYKGLAAGVYETPTPIGNVLSYRVTGLTAGTWYFTVTAVDASGAESDYATSRDDPTKRYVSKTISAAGVPILSIAAIEAISVPSITTAYATIVWQTTVECSGVVYYGTVEPITKSVKANQLGTTDHLAVIGPLVSKTHYLFKVESVCDGVSIGSSTRSFNTK
jgi:hypothetical protein